jgi:hypothetical protein
VLLSSPASAAAAPANDDFANAQDQGSQLNWEADGTTVGATLQPDEAGWFGSPTDDGGSVWYRWTAPRDMRFWVDNCTASSDTQIDVWRGSSVSALTQVDPAFANPPGCSEPGLFGGRQEYDAKAGTTYYIRVHNELYADGTFHLRFRYILFDGSLSQTASRKSVHPGQTVTFTTTVRNLGTIPFTTDVQLVTSKRGHLAQPVPQTRYVLVKTTFGKCRRVRFFAVHRGVICTLTNLQAGEKAVITTTVRPSETLSHWTYLDYAQGGDNPIYDDNRRNDRDIRHDVVVKRGR